MGCLKTFLGRLETARSGLLCCHGGDSCQERKGGAEGIPLARKVCYAVGGIPYQSTTVAMGISLQIFLLDVVQMEAFYVSMILFMSHACDAVTDPLLGYFVSRSKWTPIGKLTPWLVFSLPFGVLSYVFLWFMPQGSMSQAFSVPWFLTAACLFETLMSCYNVPYFSLNMFLGGGQRDRDSATAYRMTVAMLAMLLASAIQGQVIAVYNAERNDACLQLEQAHGTPQSTPSPETVPLQETRKAFLASALAMGGLFLLCSLVLFLGVKEQKGPRCSDEKIQVSYLTSLKMLACHIPYQRLVLGFLFSQIAFQMSSGNFALFCSHVAGLGAYFPYILLVLLSSASIAVPVWQAVLLRIGKRATVFIGLSLFIPAVIVIACVPSNLPVFMTMCVVMGFSLATTFLLPWSMLPDVVDDFAMRNPLCKDLEPLFFSCYTFCIKLGDGLSVGISTMTLHFVGYKAGACDHSGDVATALIVLFSPVPIALLLVGMGFFYFYPIKEKQLFQLETQPTTVDPEATSSPVQREKSEVTRIPLSQSSAKSSLKLSLRSHPTMKTRTLHKSNSLPYSYNYNNQKHSTRSNDMSSTSSNNMSIKFLQTSVKYSRPTSTGRCNVKPKWKSLRSYEQTSTAKWGGGSCENDLGFLSDISNVKTKVTWV